MSLNTAIAKAMFREQFLRTRPILLLCLGIILLANLVLFVVSGIAERVTGGSVSADVPGEVTLVVLAWVYVLGILMLLYRDGDASDVKLDMPAYLLRLPIRTFDLILWRMGYGLLFVAAIGVWSSGLHYLLFGTEMLYFMLFSTQMETTSAVWIPVLYGVTVFAFLQALAWCIGGAGLGVLLTAMATIVLAAWFDFEYELGQMSGYMSVDVLAWLAVCFLVAYAGVRIRRREGFGIIVRLGGALFPVFARDRGVDRPPFASPEEAMRWFEWRRQGRLLPALALCGTIAFLIILLRTMPRSPFEEYQWTSAMTVYSAAVAVAFYLGLGIAALFCGAYSLFQNQRIQLGPLKAFLFIRPVSTKDLAHARISATLRSTLISLAPFAIVCAIAIFFVARSDTQEALPFVQGHIGLDGAAIAILLLIGYSAALWCLQWPGNIVAIGSIIGVGAGIFTVIVGVGWIVVFAFPALEAVFEGIGSAFADEVFVANALLVLTLAGALLCAFIFRLAHRRGVLETKGLFMAIAAFPFLVAGFSMLQNFDAIDRGEPYNLGHLADVIPFAILAILPLATVPLAMNYARHR